MILPHCKTLLMQSTPRSGGGLVVQESKEVLRLCWLLWLDLPLLLVQLIEQKPVSRHCAHVPSRAAAQRSPISPTAHRSFFSRHHRSFAARLARAARPPACREQLLTDPAFTGTLLLHTGCAGHAAVR